jgi:NAD-dependent deacetylase
MEKIVILTGAGISAESGLGTFRDEGGLWSQHRIEDVATPEGFARDPALVHRFYNARRVQAAEAAPNPAHHALARLEQCFGDRLMLVTQNVDALHEAAGSRNVVHMHGELAGALCGTCGNRWRAPMEMQPGHACPACAAPAARPDVVWFGEMPYHMEAIEAALLEADLFVPRSAPRAMSTRRRGSVRLAAMSGARYGRAEPGAVGLLPMISQEHRRGKASEVVPAWVADILQE